MQYGGERGQEGVDMRKMKLFSPFKKFCDNTKLVLQIICNYYSSCQMNTMVLLRDVLLSQAVLRTVRDHFLTSNTAFSPVTPGSTKLD